MKSLLTHSAYVETLQRLNSLTENQKPLWGEMTPAQMVKHCQMPIEVALGRFELNRPNLLMRIFLKLLKPTMYDDKPWRPNLPTPKEFKVEGNYDFSEEKQKLLELIREFHLRQEADPWKPHPVFGELTPKQWGKMQYKHLDHHLRQFDL